MCCYYPLYNVEVYILYTRRVDIYAVTNPCLQMADVNKLEDELHVETIRREQLEGLIV